MLVCIEYVGTHPIEYSLTRLRYGTYEQCYTLYASMILRHDYDVCANYTQYLIIAEQNFSL